LISAVTGEGLEELGERIEEEFRRTLRSVDLLLPYAAGASLAELHDAAGDLERTDTPEGVRIRARVSATVAERYAQFAVDGGVKQP
jgi:GTP-binding protein HflX